MENNKIKEQKKFNFKEYYNSNPEFRQRHLAKCLTKVTCECGRMYNRCHEALHKRTKIHQRQLLAKQNKEINL